MPMTLSQKLSLLYQRFIRLTTYPLNELLLMNWLPLAVIFLHLLLLLLMEYPLLIISIAVVLQLCIPMPPP